MGERLGYQPALDGFRGLAIIAVVAAHMKLPGSGAGGIVGVTMFFVLSGFLITRLMMDEHAEHGQIDLRAFWRRRAVRLFPALAVFLAVMATVSEGWHVAAVAGYVANVVRWSGGELGLMSHTWSLAVEEQFYLLWPLLFVGLAARRLRFVTATMIVVCLVARFIHSDEAVLYFGPNRFAAISLGCLVALSGWQPSRAWQTAGAATIVAALAVPFPLAVSITVAEVGSAVMVASLVGSRALTWGPLVVVGRRSYGLYLWHFPVVFGPPWWLLPRPLALAGMVLVSWLLTSLSWDLVERPAHRRLRKPATFRAGT